MHLIEGDNKLRETIYKAKKSIKKSLTVTGIKKFFRSRFTVQDNFMEMQKSWLPDKYYIKQMYKLRMRSDLNLKNPKSFNEKLNWLKLYNRVPEYTTMVDKYAVKQYIKDKIGEEYVIPLIGVFDRIEDIDYNALPKSFVIKCSHDGGVYICKDKTKLNVEKANKWIEYHLSRNYYKWQREWPYKNVKPRIIIEQFIEDDVNPELRVYKVFCFNGRPYIIQMINGDKTDHEYINYYDVDWNLLEIKQNFPNGPIDAKPLLLDKLLKLSSQLSENIPFLRTDFYIAQGKILFSEFTFFTDAGMEPYIPEKWDFILGDMLILPSKKIRRK